MFPNMFWSNLYECIFAYAIVHHYDAHRHVLHTPIHLTLENIGDQMLRYA